FEARVANEPPYDCAVLLLDPRLIVLSVCAGDLESRSETPIDYGVVHEHAIVVEIDAAQREGKQTAHAKQCVDNQRSFANQQRNTFRPASRDVGRYECLDEATLDARAAVGDQVDLEKSRQWVIPVGKGPYRHATPYRRAETCSSTKSTARHHAHIREEAINSRRTHGRHERAIAT